MFIVFDWQSAVGCTVAAIHCEEGVAEEDKEGLAKEGNRTMPTNIKGLLEGHRPCQQISKDYWKATGHADQH